MAKYEIIYEDESILVVHKKAGVAVETAKVGESDLVSELKKYLRRNAKGDYLGVVHRLDQPVEGLMVFGLNPKVTATLSQAVSNKGLMMDKIYSAKVYGHMPRNKGELRDYLIKDSKSNSSRVTDDKKGKLAILEYEVVASNDDTDTVRITLKTGRHHQIRVQLSAIGCPILGDAKYGSSESKEYSKRMGIRNISLCACELTFAHPVSNKQLEFKYKGRKNEEENN